jgi:O-antigen/teichoic acid export membrane protein
MVGLCFCYPGETYNGEGHAMASPYGVLHLFFFFAGTKYSNDYFCKKYLLNPLRKLAGQTAIYGTTTIVYRLINYFLVPIHTYIFHKDQYGVVSEMYAYVALLIVLLTYGMETAFFRYYENKDKDKEKVYSTTLLSLLISSVVFICFMVLFSQQIANIIKYKEHPEYIIWFALVIVFDAISTIPFAKLRVLNRPKMFAFIKLFGIIICFVLNILFLYGLPYFYKHNILSGLVSLIYRPGIGVGYIFIANLISSGCTLLLLFIVIPLRKLRFDPVIWRRMMIYALPLLIFGLAGNINETFDRILLKYLSPAGIALAQVGIYGACYKLSLLMTIVIQGFKYAAEPFFFSYAKETDARNVYADIMKYFVIVCSLIFLGVMLYIDLFKYFIGNGKEFWEGLRIVPILLLANMFLGIFYNLSIWYKLTDKTRFGAYLSMIGAVITLTLNFTLIPVIGYMGSAWATFACYGSMMILSFFIGQKHYYVKYNMKKIGAYFGLAMLLYFVSIMIKINSTPIHLMINSVFFLFYIFVVIYNERPSLLKIKR